jgi:hypothetical protein
MLAVPHESAQTQANPVCEGSRSSGVRLYDRMVRIWRETCRSAVIDALRASQSDRPGAAERSARQ